MCRSEFSADKLLRSPASGDHWRLSPEQETSSTNSALQKRRRRRIVFEQQVHYNRLTSMSARCLSESNSNAPQPECESSHCCHRNNGASKHCLKSNQCDLQQSGICASNSLNRCYACYSRCCYSSSSCCYCCYLNRHNAFNNERPGRHISILNGAVGYHPEADGGGGGGFNRIMEAPARDVDENDYRRPISGKNNTTKTQQLKFKIVDRRTRRRRAGKHLALANVLIMLPIFIFLLEIIPCDSSSLSTASRVEGDTYTNEENITEQQLKDFNMAKKKGPTSSERRQSFRRRPQPIVETMQGQSILLNCEINDQEGPVQWIKEPGIYIFHNNRTRANNHSDFDHFKVPNTGEGDYSLLIERASEKDSGYYECQVPGKIDDGHELQAGSQLKVIPQPPPAPPSSPPSPIVVATTSVLSNSSISNNELNMLARSAPSESGSLQYSRNTSVGKTLNYLPSSNFISPHASNAHPTAASTIGPSSAHLVASWPYLLLLIAGLLMLANVYLVYSLFKRHQRKKDNSLESASSGSAGTGSSRVETTEQPNSSPLEFYPSSPSVLVTSSGASSAGGYNNMSAAAAAAATGCGSITGPNGPTYQPNAGYAAPIMHGIYQLPGSWVLEC